MYIPHAARNKKSLEPRHDLWVKDVERLSPVMIPGLIGAHRLCTQGVEELPCGRENAHDGSFGRDVSFELRTNAWVRQRARPGGGLV